MTTHTPASGVAAALRKRILSNPAVVLDDPEIMEALASAQSANHGGNVVDMRSMAMARLETRLDRLEETHQTVIAAAYDSVAVTRQVHRALLTMIAPLEFDEFLAGLNGEVADCLRARAIRLVIETRTGEKLASPAAGCDAIATVPEGYTTGYRGGGRKAKPQDLILRRVQAGAPEVYGDLASQISSEAVMALDLGPSRLPGMLAIGAASPDAYRPGDATDLLEVFAAVFERLLRSWL
ncbi:MAG: DUF484 family protein [Rhodobacteraceae bacterium]|nr:DUF484 family protein [Paracoccaceae bacterium]